MGEMRLNSAEFMLMADIHSEVEKMDGSTCLSGTEGNTFGGATSCLGGGLTGVIAWREHLS